MPYKAYLFILGELVVKHLSTTEKLALTKDNLQIKNFFYFIMFENDAHSVEITP